MMWRLTQHSNWELRLGRSHSILTLSYHRLSHDPDKVVPGEVLGSRPVQNTGGFLSCRVEQDNPDRDIITGSRYSSDICLWFDVIVQLLADNVDRNTDDGNDVSLVSDLMRSSICSALVIFTSAWMKNLKQNRCIYEKLEWLSVASLYHHQWRVCFTRQVSKMKVCLTFKLSQNKLIISERRENLLMECVNNSHSFLCRGHQTFS